MPVNTRWVVEGKHAIMIAKAAATFQCLTWPSSSEDKLDLIAVHDSLAVLDGVL